MDRTDTTIPAGIAPLPQKLLIGGLLALIALLPVVPAFFSDRYPATHESFRYEELTLLFREAIANGHLYPRWLPDLAGGRGYPTFVFYQPLVFWVSSLVSLLPLAASKWMYVVDYLFFIVGAAGAYRIARLELDRMVCLAVAAMFILTPYLFVNLHVRGDHSELASMMILPWPLFALFELRRRILAGTSALAPALLGAISLAGVICSHPATALAAIPLIGLLASIQTLSLPASHRKQWLQLTVCVCLLALATASPYWFCVWQCKPFAHLERISQNYFQAEFHSVSLARLLSIDWSFGVSASKLGDQKMVEMPMPIGLLHLLLAFGGIIAGVRKPWIKSFSVTYILLLFLLLPAATGFWSIQSNPLRAIQFPWRLLAVIAPIQLVLIVALLARASSFAGRSMPWIAVGLVVLIAGVQWKMFQVSDVPHRTRQGARLLTWSEADAYIRGEVAEMPQNFHTFAGMAEFDPIWIRMRLDPRGAEPLLTSLDPVELLPDHSKYLISARLTATKDSGVRIEQYYFPGWHVEVNGAVIPDDELRASVMDDGRMLVPIPAGVSTLRAYYAGPPLAALRYGAAAILAIGCGVMLVKCSRKPSSNDIATADVTA